MSTQLVKNISIGLLDFMAYQPLQVFKLFKQLYVTIKLSVNTVLMSKNSSIWNNSVKHKHAV